MREQRVQSVLQVKTTNRYMRGEKVIIVSREYVWGVIEEVYIRNRKIRYKVRVEKKYSKKGHRLVPENISKLPEEALLPYIKKWQWKLIKWLGIVR